MKTVAVHNLGCKVNGYELDVMVQKLKEAGYTLVPFTQKADVYVINTCTVTNIADRKSRQMLHRAKEMNPDAVVVAVGCYVETDEKRVEEDPAIDLAIGNNKKGQIAQLLSAYLADKEDDPERKILDGRTMEDLTEHPAFEDMQLTQPEHTRAYVKIQDGCNQFCTYCIIPMARGRIRSRDMDEILEEITGLAQRGIREVVITGIHIGSYGRDWGKSPEEELIALLTRIQMVKGIERIRLGSLEPMTITENFVRHIAGLSKVCPHFHLSLQSGCDRTLQRMNRHYSAEEFRRCTQILRRYYDRPALTTDVIVGFPGETEEDFRESADFVRSIGFFELHVFKYSRRHGTVADRMPEQLTDREKSKRSAVLLAMAKEGADAYRAQFIGERDTVLLEEKISLGGQDYYTGHTSRYIEALVAESEAMQALCASSGEQVCGRNLCGVFTAAEPGTGYLHLSPAERDSLKSRNE